MAAAQDAEAEALEAAAEVAFEYFDELILNDPDTNANGTVSAAEKAAWIEDYIANNDPADDLNEAEADLAAAMLALAGERDDLLVGGYNNADLNDFVGQVATDARLNQMLAVAEAAVADDDTAAGLAEDLADAEAALDAAREDADDAAVLVALRDAIVAAAAGGDIVVGDDYVAMAETFQDVLDIIATALTTADDPATAGTDDRAEALATALNDIAALTPTAEAIAVAEDQIDAVVARDGLITDVSDAEDLFALNGLGEDLLDVQALVDARAEFVEAVADAQAVLDAVEPVAEAYAAAVAATAAAAEVIEVDNDFVLGEIGTDNATAGNDLFVYNSTNDADLANFGATGNDLIYFGTGYTLVTMAEGEDDTDIDGDVNALEIFVVTDGDDLILYVEENAFDGNATNNGDMVEIVLTGLAEETLQLTSSGYLSVA